MFYLLNFENHEFISCNNASVAEAKIRDLLASGYPKDSLEIVDASDVDGRMEVDAFRTLCAEWNLVDNSIVDALVKKEPVRSVQAEEPTIALWARLGVSLNVTPGELAALKHPYDQNAKNLLVDLVRSDRCCMDGETYFPADPNEEYLGDMGEELEFDLAGALHKDALASLAKIPEGKIAAAKQCLIDNGIDADEAETVLQALGYILMDKELVPEAEERAAEKLPPALDDTIARAKAEASAGKENSVAAPSRDRI